MKLDLNHLPDNLHLLHQLIRDLTDENTAFNDENTSLKAQLALLKKVLENIQDHNSQKLHELLPWNINLHITEKADH